MPRLRKGIMNGGIDYTMYGIPDMVVLMSFIAPVETWHATSLQLVFQRTGTMYPALDNRYFLRYGRVNDFHRTCRDVACHVSEKKQIIRDLIIRGKGFRLCSC